MEFLCGSRGGWFQSSICLSHWLSSDPTVALIQIPLLHQHFLMAEPPIEPWFTLELTVKEGADAAFLEIFKAVSCFCRTSIPVS